MAKQMIKGLTMLMLLATLSLVTAVVSANGQSSNRQVANIPFEFVVGDKEMPAGKYQVATANATGGTLKILGITNTNSAFRLSNTITQAQPVEQGKMVFHRYRNQYFLAEVWTAGERQGRQLTKCSAEKAIERELASNRSQKYERVEIALVR
jgi:hypothetical protein